MPRLPRDCGAKELIKLLSSHGYDISRQTGSHIRLHSKESGHSITVPDHSPIKVGTLSAILGDVSVATGLDRDTLVRELIEQ